MSGRCFRRRFARCEAGETGGIIVARFDRFARSAVDALESIKRLNEAGARLVSVEDNFDGSTPMGRFAIGILSLIAELELERIKENWGTAIRAAVDRASTSRRACRPAIEATRTAGWSRDEPAASVVGEVFRRRAAGASYTELAVFMNSRGCFRRRGIRIGRPRVWRVCSRTPCTWGRRAVARDERRSA